MINKKNGWNKPNHITNYENTLKEILDNLEPLIDNFVDTSIQKFLQTVSFLDFNEKIKQKFVKLIELYNKDAKKENNYFLKENFSLGNFLSDSDNIDFEGGLVSKLAFKEFEKTYHQYFPVPIIYNLQTKELELVLDLNYVDTIGTGIKDRYYYNKFLIFNSELFFERGDVDFKYQLIDLLVALYTETISEGEFKNYLREVFQDALKFQYLLLTQEIPGERIEYLPVKIRGFSLVEELEYLNSNGIRTEIIPDLIAAYPEINAEVLVKHLQYNKLTEFFWQDVYNKDIISIDDLRQEWVWNWYSKNTHLLEIVDVKTLQDFLDTVKAPLNQIFKTENDLQNFANDYQIYKQLEETALQYHQEKLKTPVKLNFVEDEYIIQFNYLELLRVLGGMYSEELLKIQIEDNSITETMKEFLESITIYLSREKVRKDDNKLVCDFLETFKKHSNENVDICIPVSLYRKNEEKITFSLNEFQRKLLSIKDSSNYNLTIQFLSIVDEQDIRPSEVVKVSKAITEIVSAMFSLEIVAEVRGKVVSPYSYPAFCITNKVKKDLE